MDILPASRPVLPAATFKAPFERWLRGCVPVLKGVYLPTGSGKTYSTQALAVDAFEAGVIPIYIAPLKRLIEDFEPGLRELMVQRGLEIPIYRLYARDDLVNSEALLEEAMHFCIAAQGYLVRDRDLFDDDPTAQDEDEDEAQAERGYSPAQWIARIRKSSEHYRRIKVICEYDPGNKEIQDDLVRVFGIIKSGLNALSLRLVQHALFNDLQQRIYHDPRLRPMLLKLRPFDLFAGSPGIITATASKFASGVRDYVLEHKKLGAPVCRPRDFVNVFEWAGQHERRSALFVDEEEEAYQYVFKSMKSELTNRDIDLQRLVYAFFHYFDLTAFSNYADSEGERFARKLFGATEAILGELPKIRQIMLSSEDVTERIERLGALRSLQGFEPAWLRVLVEDFLSKHDIHNGFQRLRRKLSILKTIRCFIEASVRPFVDSDAKEDAFDVYRRLLKVFHDKKHILVDAITFKSFHKQLAFLFFTERLEFYNHSVLEEVRLVPSVANSNIELIGADALRLRSPRIQRESFSLGEFIRLLMLITRVLVKTTIHAPEGDTKRRRVTDNQWKVLVDYKKKVSKWNIDKDALPEMPGEAQDEPLDDDVVFRRPKLTMGFVEDTLERIEYASNLRIMSIATVVLRDTPEDLLDRFLSAKRQDAPDAPGNLVFLMTATGGMHGCRSGYNLTYLSQRLGALGGRFEGMTEPEYAFAAQFAEFRQALRKTEVADFDFSNFVTRIGSKAAFAPFDLALNSELDALKERNPHKLAELSYMMAVFGRIITGSERSAFVLTQTVTRIRQVLENFAARGMGVEADPRVSGVYTLDPSSFGLSGDPVRIVLYLASFGKTGGRFVDGEFRSFEECELAEDAGEEESLLQSVLDERTHKLVLISSFSSAARGINFIVKGNGGLAKDFDLLMIAMSPYYDGLYRVPTQELVQIERLQAMLEHLYLKRRLGQYTYRDLPELIADEHEEAFRDEYFRKIGRDLTQAFGRVERSIQGPCTQTLLLNAEVVGELAQFYKIEPEFHLRLSATSLAVHAHVQDYMRHNAMFATEAQWQAYVRTEIIQGLDFVKASKRIYRGFRNNAYRQAWLRIRDVSLFTDPQGYLAGLDLCPEGVDEATWQAFTQYLFVARNPSQTRYLLRADKALNGLDPEQDEHWIEQVRCMREPLYLHADLQHGNGRAFEPAKALVPLGLHDNPVFVATCKHLGIVPAQLFETWLPRHRFFNDYIKGYFAELIAESVLRSKRGLRLIDPAAHPRAAEIFERFDLFVETEHKVFALDLKNWGRRTDRKAGRALREAVLRKTRTVESALQIPKAMQRKTVRDARAVAALLGTKPVVPIYLNLAGDRSYYTEVFDGMRVHFYNLFVAHSDEQNWQRYELNQALMGMLRPEGF